MSYIQCMFIRNICMDKNHTIFKKGPQRWIYLLINVVDVKLSYNFLAHSIHPLSSSITVLFTSRQDLYCHYWIQRELPSPVTWNALPAIYNYLYISIIHYTSVVHIPLSINTLDSTLLHREHARLHQLKILE